MTNAQIKAYLIIWNKTHFLGKKSRKITNNEFIEIGGKSLANKPAVKNATNWLHENNLVFKVRDPIDSHNWFCINTNLEGVTVL